MNDTKQSLFPPKEEGKGYGLFGYEGAMCDLAIWRDNVGQVEEAAARGWITPETETFDGMRLVGVAKKRGSPNVAKRLVELGWADEEWNHAPVTSVVWGMEGHVSTK
jgi:hypothetical protein